ncbi:hypothetical protein HMPREF3198_02057 [Winkia neuii]|nr:hypothetical protein HMPREF3198_02057 [Winkia neuii]
MFPPAKLLGFAGLAQVDARAALAGFLSLSHLRIPPCCGRSTAAAPCPAVAASLVPILAASVYRK